MFDPSIGRWLQVDPSSFAAGDSNLYRYVENDPTNATDPSGLVLLVGDNPVKKGDDVYNDLLKIKKDDKLIREILDRMIVAGVTYRYSAQAKLANDIRMRLLVVAAAEQLAKLPGGRFQPGGERTAGVQKGAPFWEEGDRGITTQKGADLGQAIDAFFGPNAGKYTYDCASAACLAVMKARADFLRQQGKAVTDPDGKKAGVLDGFYKPNPWVSDVEANRALLPGDIRFINNPGYTVAAWHMEVLIYLGNNLYCGHTNAGKSFGIKTRQQWETYIRDNYTKKDAESQNAVKLNLLDSRRPLAPGNDINEGKLR